MHFTNIGDIRGCCGHKHRNMKSATKCLKDDQIGCERQGGYSDRLTKIVDKGHFYELSPDEYRFQDHLLANG
jgi:hypothetical protein